jgi:hypothetical protein
MYVTPPDPNSLAESIGVHWVIWSHWNIAWTYHLMVDEAIAISYHCLSFPTGPPKLDTPFFGQRVAEMRAMRLRDVYHVLHRPLLEF